jgi:hypothetical protein
VDDDRSDAPLRPDGPGGSGPAGVGPTTPGGPTTPWGPPPPWQAERFAVGRSHADTALILGILSVVVLPLLGPFAIWQAREAEKLGTPAVPGRVLGWVGTVLLGVLVLFLVLWLVAVVFLISSGSSV